MKPPLWLLSASPQVLKLPTLSPPRAQGFSPPPGKEGIKPEEHSKSESARWAGLYYVFGWVQTRPGAGLQGEEANMVPECCRVAARACEFLSSVGSTFQHKVQTESQPDLTGRGAAGAEGTLMQEHAECQSASWSPGEGSLLFGEPALWQRGLVCTSPAEGLTGKTSLSHWRGRPAAGRV